jgi:Arc/MetJ-type ribon-helix-helix transcriptional regulator
MRQVLSLSLPERSSEKIKELAQKRGFKSVSEYIKYLIDLDSNLISDTELLNSVKKAREEYKTGTTIKANSLADLI